MDDVEHVLRRLTDSHYLNDDQFIALLFDKHVKKLHGPAFNETVERWKTLTDFSLHADNLSALPAARLKNLALYSGMTSVFNIARMLQQKRMAVLVAFVLAWETLALALASACSSFPAPSAEYR